MKTIQVNIGAYFREELLSMIANSGRLQQTNPDLLRQMIEGFDFDLPFENFFRSRRYARKSAQSTFDQEMNKVFDQVDHALGNAQADISAMGIKKLGTKMAKGRMEDNYLNDLFKITLLALG